MNDQLAGFYQSARNLSFVVIYNASHMVPVDQPIAALDMLNRAIGANDTIMSILLDVRATGCPILLWKLFDVMSFSSRIQCRRLLRPRLESITMREFQDVLLSC